MDILYTLYDSHEYWFHFGAFLLATFVVAHIVTLAFKKVIMVATSKTKTDLDDKLMGIVQKPLYWGIILGGFYYAFLELPTPDRYATIMGMAVKVGFYVMLTFVVVSVSKTLFLWFEGKDNLRKRQKSMILTVQKIINVVIYFLGLIFILDAVGVSISPLIASLGIGGLAVGLALQPTLSNYFSGLYVAADGFIQPGDYIELDNGTKGVVKAVGWRNMNIKLWNNSLITIPNSIIADSAIINHSEPQLNSSFVVKFGVAYNSDLEKVEKVSLDLAKKFQKDERFGVEKYEPLFRCYNFGDSSIDCKVIMQAHKFVDHYFMTHEFIKALKATFDKENITIAFPTRSIEFLNKPQ